MQNKKLLSVVLALAMVFALALGVLIVDAGAVEPTSVTVGTPADDYETIAEALAAAKEMPWEEGASLILELTTDEVEMTADTGILFGAETILDAAGNRLPITITPAEGAATTLTLAQGYASEINCANSYTFKNLAMDLAYADVTFYAGSGEVVLENVDLDPLDGTLAAHFSADCSNALAFKGWAEPAGDLIHTSLEFKNTDYETGYVDEIDTATGLVHAVKAEADFYNAEIAPVSAANLSAELIVTDSKLGDLWLRPHTALSPVGAMAYTQNDSSDDDSLTQIGALHGIGKISGSAEVSYGTCDALITVNGGTVNSHSRFYFGGMMDGSVKITVNGGHFPGQIEFGYGASLETGGVTGNFDVVINDGLFDAGVYGSNVASRSELGIWDTVTVNGGYITRLEANRVSGKAIVTINGGFIKKYYGTYNTEGGGGMAADIVTNLNGGFINYYIGTGGDKDDNGVTYKIDTVTNNLNGGAILTSFAGTGETSRGFETVINNFNGTAFGATQTGGTDTADDATDDVYSALNTELPEFMGKTFIKPAEFKTYGSRRSALTIKSLTNNLNVTLGTHSFYGTGSDTNGRVINNMNGTEEKPLPIPRFRGLVGDATYLENNFTYISGLAGESYSMSEGANVKGDVVNNFDHVSSKFGLYLVQGTVEGNATNDIRDSNFYASKDTGRYVKFFNADVAGDATLNLVNSIIDTTQYVSYLSAGKTVQGDFTVTLENTTIKSTSVPTGLAAGYIGNAGTVVGTMKTVVKGNSTFASPFYGSYGPAGKVVNEIEGGTFKGFYGTGALVTGLFAPAEEEGAEPVQTEVGSVNNNVSGGVIGAFYGTASVTGFVGDVNNNITGGNFDGFYSSYTALTGDVTTSIIGQANVARDELISAVASENYGGLIHVDNFYGPGNGTVTGNVTNILHNLHTSGNSNMTNSIITGNLKCEVTNTYFGANLFDINTNMKTTNLIFSFQDVIFGGVVQFANRPSSVLGNMVVELDSVWFMGSNCKTMNPATGACEIFYYGDIRFGSESAGTVLYLQRQDPQAVIHIGAKPTVNEENALVTDVEKVETSLTALHPDSYVNGTYDKTSSSTNAHTIKLYDVTLDGITVVPKPTWLDKVNGTSVSSINVSNLKLLLCGDVTLKNGAYLVATGVDAESITVKQAEDWSGGICVELPAEDLDKINVENRGDQAGVGFKEVADELGYVAGANIFEDTMVSVSIDDRFHLNTWLSENSVAGYLTAGGADEVTISAASASAKLGSVTMTLDEFRALIDPESGYAKIALAAMAADKFDEAIVITLSFGDITILIDSVWGEELTLLNLAKAGVENTEMAISDATAADANADTTQLQKELALFKAIYNYGASFSGDAAYTMDGFVADEADDPVYEVTANEKITFTGLNLLMGDTVGIRFKATADVIPALTMAVNGEAAELIYVKEIGGFVCVDIFVHAETFAQEMNVVIASEGETVLTATLSVKGYTELVKDYGAKELALAQLVQACCDMVSANV